MVSGWMIARNAMRAGYPIVEAILSVLPLCDEFVVMNDSCDSTEEVLTRMGRRYGKIRVVNRPWPFRKYRDHALAMVTQWGMDECRGDWLICVQADEVFHESALPRMQTIIDGDLAPAVAFHRMQLSENFQTNHAEHAVTRMAKRGNIQAAGDALSFTVKDDQYLSFDRLGEFSMFDITRCFAGNFPGKAFGQAEIWHHLPNRNKDGWFGKTPEEWAVAIRAWDQIGYPELWTRRTSPFLDILPTSMKRWVGEVRYAALPELVD